VMMVVFQHLDMLETPSMENCLKKIIQALNEISPLGVAALALIVALVALWRMG